MGEKDEKVDWVRKPKEVDLRKVNSDKMNRATVERGIEFETPMGGVGKTKVTKVVVRSMPAPDENSSQ